MGSIVYRRNKDLLMGEDLRILVAHGFADLLGFTGSRLVVEDTTLLVCHLAQPSTPS